MFKVGQLVWCKRKNCYGITDYHVKCKVVCASDEEKTIRIQVVEGFGKGNAYTVYADDFEPVYKKAVIV